MLFLIDKSSIMIARLFNKDVRLQAYKITYVVLEQLVQLASVLITALILGIVKEFIIMFTVYIIVRMTRQPLHFKSYYQCFAWSYCFFLILFIAIYFIKFYDYNSIAAALVFGVIAGICLSSKRGNHEKKIN